MVEFCIPSSHLMMDFKARHFSWRCPFIFVLSKIDPIWLLKSQRSKNKDDWAILETLTRVINKRTAKNSSWSRELLKPSFFNSSFLSASSSRFYMFIFSCCCCSLAFFALFYTFPRNFTRFRIILLFFKILRFSNFLDFQTS